MSTLHKIRIGFVAALVLCLGVVGLSYRTTARLIDTNRLVVRSTGAIRHLDGTIAALDNLERSRLAWVMAGRAMHDLRLRRSRELTCRICHDSHRGESGVETERFHNTHLAMIADLTLHVQELRNLTSYDPVQQEKLRLLEPLILKKTVLARQGIESQKAGIPDQLTPVVIDQELDVTNEIRQIVAAMDQTESRSLAQQLQERESTARNEILTVGLLGFLTIFLTLIAYTIIRRDLIQRDALEEQLRQTMKMEAVGRLAGGVAHDFNNLLTPILFCTELLQNDLGENHPAIERVHDIKKAGETAASVTHQLLAFSRKQTLQPQKLNLNNVATNLSNMLRRLVGEQYSLKTVLEPALGWVEADPSQVEQVIMNLVLNARDALPKGGTIAIETANADLNGERVCWGGLALEGAYVVLTVSDDGVGMTEETRSRVFEPFFTTKQQGRGTGLGLATVYGIITQSNGRVRLESAPDQGTKFEIYLPRVEPPAERSHQHQVEKGAAQRNGTILLVEDDEAVRCLVRGVLVASGYRVLEASDGEAGWLAAKAFGEGIDLVITDVMMPKMNGPELYRRLAEQHPALKSIFVSGHSGGIVSADYFVDGKTMYLAKPFTPSALLEKVGRLLEGTTGIRPK